MNSSVGAFEAAVSRPSQGVILLPNDGATNVLHDAAPASNKRLDLIWTKQNDGVSPNADSDSLPKFGILKGVASASPTPYTYASAKAALAAGAPGAGAEPLAVVEIPSTATSMQSANVIYTQLYQYTATTGGVLWFRNSTERDAATFAEGQLCWLIDTDTLQSYNGSGWRNLTSSSLMVPTTATNGTVAANGTVSSSSTTIVRPNGVFTSAFPRYEVKFDITTASSTTLSAALSVAGTDTTTGYDNQRHTDINATSAAAQSLNATGIILGGGTASTRHVGSLFFDTNPAATGETYFRVDATVSPNPMTTAHGKYLGSGLQRATTQFDGVSFAAASGNLTVNYVAVIGSF